MEATDFQDRLYQAFLRGYQDFAGYLSAANQTADTQPLPYTSIILSATLESRELRRSIDACRSALAQIADLPEAEKEQLRKEVRATLDYLISASDKLLARLRSLRATPESTDNPDTGQPAAPRPHKSGRATKPPRRR